jgi:DNA-binding transcriptional ArsR family regulator
MRDCKTGRRVRTGVRNATPAWVIEQIESWRREHKWSAQRSTEELASIGFVIDRRTVSRHLTRLGLGKRRFIDPGGENNRKPGKITARWPGHMVHLDVKKVGRIPDGGGWRIHGRDRDQARVASRAKSAGAKRGYIYLHSVVDGFSRLAYTEPLGDEKGATAAVFSPGRRSVRRPRHQPHPPGRHRQWRLLPLRRLRPHVGQGTRHQRTKPYTPRHTGKVERYQRIMAEEVLYSREFTSEDARSAAIAVLEHPLQPPPAA